MEFNLNSSNGGKIHALKISKKYSIVKTDTIEIGWIIVISQFETKLK